LLHRNAASPSAESKVISERTIAALAAAGLVDRPAEIQVRRGPRDATRTNGGDDASPTRCACRSEAQAEGRRA